MFFFAVIFKYSNQRKYFQWEKIRGEVFMKKFFKILFLVIIFCLLSTVFFCGESELPNLQMPVVVTPCGQSPGALMFRLVCMRSKITCKEIPLLNSEELKNGGYKTLVIITGTSGKGMGAAGIDINQEIKRVKELISTAKELGIKIIGAHIEGMARRVDSMDAASIESVMPESDLILVIEDSNSDGYFTKLSDETGIPALIAKDSMGVGNALKPLFE